MVARAVIHFATRPCREYVTGEIGWSNDQIDCLACRAHLAQVRWAARHIMFRTLMLIKDVRLGRPYKYSDQKTS